MFLKISRLVLGLVPTIVSLAIVSNAKAEISKRNWQSFNCHLGVTEWALLNALEKKSAAEDVLSSVQKTARTTENRPEPVLPPVLRELMDNMTRADQELSNQLAPMKGIPGYAESKATILAATKSFDALSFEELVQTAHRNPALRACQLLLNPKGDVIETIARMSLSTNRGTALYTRRLPLLAIINLADPERFSDLKKKGASDEDALARSIEMPDEINRMTGSEYIHAIKWVLARASDDAIEKGSSTRLQTRIASTTVNWGGKPFQHRVSISTMDFPTGSSPVSQRIGAEIRSNLLVNDEVLNSFELSSKNGTSYSSSQRPAFMYRVGDTNREKTVERAIENCMRSFQIDSKQTAATALIRHFNAKCGRTENLKMFFVVSDREEIGPSSQTSSEREFLRLAGHRTDYDGTVSGLLFVTSADAFDHAFAKAFAITKQRPVSAREVQEAQADLARRLTEMWSRDPRSKTLPKDRAQNEQAISQFLTDGGIGFVLSSVSGSSDSIQLRLAYRKGDGRVDIIGLSSDTTMAMDVVSRFSDQIPADAKPMIDSLLGDSGGASNACMRQTGLIENLVQGALQRTPKHRTAALAKAKEIESLLNQSLATMAPQCRATFNDEFRKIIANAQAQAARMN